MLNLLLFIFGLSLLPYIEAFFWTTGLGSVLLIVALQWVIHSRNDIFRLIILLVAGVIFEAGVGLFFGSSVIVILLLILGYAVFEKFMPMHNTIIKYCGILVLFLIGNILFGIFANGHFSIPIAHDSIFLFGVLKSTLSEFIIFILIDIVTSMFNTPSTNRLKI